MKLAAQSQEQIERFLREHFGDPGLRLPPIRIYCGPFAHLVTAALRIGAITFGRLILVSPGLVRRRADGRVYAPGWLIAHEATHVWQYRRHGFVGFLTRYLRNYWRALRGCGRWDRAARLAAYLAIEEECAAREAEEAYRAWVRAGEAGWRVTSPP